MGVSITVPFAVSHIEANTNLSLVDLVTVTFNMAGTVDVMSFAFPHVQYPVNGVRGLALSTVEGKEPSFTAVVAVVDSEGTIPVDMEDGMTELLLENTILKKKTIDESK